MKLKKLAAFAAAAITTVCLFTFSVSAKETVYEEVPEPSIEDYYDEYEEPDYYYSILEDGTAAITGYNGSDWNQISGKSFVEAIFKYKKGQCAQYNGAMACMMAYLGYNVRIVQGYRGTWNTNYWQHFWVEIPLYGVNYIMETGNYGKNGSWMYFLAPYKYTSGYIRNCKNM